MRTYVLDLETIGIPNAADFVQDTAPGNYKKPDAIAEYIREETPKRIAAAALDVDLAQIVAFGFFDITDRIQTGSSLFAPEALESTINDVMTADQTPEAQMLEFFIERYRSGDRLVTFNGRGYDLPLLERRLAYLDVVGAPRIPMDRYKGSQIDVYDRLTHFGACGAHKLDWFKRRFDWTDLINVSTISDGSQVAGAVEREEWEELAKYCAGDLLATARLVVKFPRLLD